MYDALFDIVPKVIECLAVQLFVFKEYDQHRLSGRCTVNKVMFEKKYITTI